MAFNSTAYYRNKWRRQAIAELREARQHKATTGDSYWIASAVSRARSSWRLYLSQRFLCELQRESRNANRPASKHRAPYKPAPWSKESKI